MWCKYLQSYLCVILEVFFNQLVDGPRYKHPVFVRHQPVIEHPQALVPPDSNKAVRTLKSLGHGDREPVVDTGKVTQVEDVVEFGGCGG